MRTYFNIKHKELIDRAIELMPEYIFYHYVSQPKMQIYTDVALCNDDEFIFYMDITDYADNNTFEQAIAFISGYLAANNIKIEDF